MKVQELKDELIKEGFQEEELDTGFNYTITIGNIELICYIEPLMNASFLILYKWDDNDVKGTYDISIAELNRTKHTVGALFRQAIDNLPQYIGTSIDTHEETERVLDAVF